MWDFLIVLGQIPGTHIQITFWEIVGGSLVGMVALVLRKKHRAHLLSAAKLLPIDNKKLAKNLSRLDKRRAKTRKKARKQFDIASQRLIRNKNLAIVRPTAKRPA